MCKDLAILDKDGNVLNPNSTTFKIGMILKFRCAADDPANQITRYEFKLTEPDGTIIEGSKINPAGSSTISLEYQIDQYLNYQVQCRACIGSICQPYKSIVN